jgi:hypothetical protein
MKTAKPKRELAPGLRAVHLAIDQLPGIAAITERSGKRKIAALKADREGDRRKSP